MLSIATGAAESLVALGTSQQQWSIVIHLELCGARRTDVQIPQAGDVAFLERLSQPLHHQLGKIAIHGRPTVE
jgi:hypothetical protein